MTLPELLEALKPYPVLQSMVLSTMTDDDFLDYIRGLQTDTAENAASGGGGVSASTPPDALATLSALRDAVEGGALKPLCNEHADISSLMEAWTGVALVEQHKLSSPQLTVEWHKHIVGNLLLADEEGFEAETKSLPWGESAQTAIEHLVAKRVAISIVDDLGTDVFSAVFGGPRRSTLVFSGTALHGAHDIERDFILYHMFAHLLAPRHMPFHSFGIRLEYRFGRTPKELLSPADSPYIREENEADDAASCMMHSEYGAGAGLSSISRAIVKGAMAEGATVQQIRSLFQERRPAPERLFNFINNAWQAVLALNVGRIACQPLPYYGSLRVLKGSDRQVYVAGKDLAGNQVRRWVCSHRVLTRLGLTITDVKQVSDAELGNYQRVRPLLDPSEVDEARGMLIDGVVNRRDRRFETTVATEERL